MGRSRRGVEWKSAEKESSRGGGKLRRGKSSKDYTHEKLGSEEWWGKEWRREGKDRIAPHSCCSPSLP